MPNIELHGYTGEDAVTMREKVRAALITSAEADEIVTTIFPSQVESLKGKKMPYLRVISSPSELPDLKERLKPLREDIEVLLLEEWIPSE